MGLLDLDAFFASVEQLDHPDWRGRPVVVGGDAERRGVVSTASYEARRFGIHSAMPSAQARRLCPEAIWTHGHFDRYREMSARVMALIGDETPYVEQVSIDEAFFDVTPGRFSRESPIDICARIASNVSKLGITCSIGLGTNKTVAKIASERDKPRGLTVVPPGCELTFLSPLSVRAMSGVGKAAEAKLLRMGIRTLGQLAVADEASLGAVFGVNAARMRERAAGREVSHVGEAARPSEAKSISNERTFSTDLTSEHDIRAAIGSVSSMLGRRLRARGVSGDVVTLKLKYDFAHTRTARRTLGSPTNDEDSLASVAQDLLRQIWDPGMPVRLVGVGLSGLDGASPRQLGLFEAQDAGVDEGRRRLLETTDRLRERFGDAAPTLGRDLGLEGRTTGTAPQHKDDR